MTVVDKILFTCSACQYRARIPSHYAGRSIHCPGCKTIQAVAAIEEAGAPPSAPVAKLDTPLPGHPVLTTGSTSPAPTASKIVFACSACSYKGRLAAEYDGKTIRCPGCQTAQVVHGTPAPAPIVASLAADETAFRGGESEKIRFACSACGYRARIPGKYADKPIHCPQCKQIQVPKAETDLEEATGRTVSISRVTPATVNEPRLAMTNVGVQFHCAVCGYQSRISPSCAGDAIYCPSCRAPQKVEWGDPAALAAAAAAMAPAIDPPARMTETGTSPLPVVPASKPVAVRTPPEVAPEPVAAQSAQPQATKKSSRRIVTAGGGKIPAAPAPVAATPAPEVSPAIGATAATGSPPRRSAPVSASVPTPIKSKAGGSETTPSAVPASAQVARAAEPVGAGSSSAPRASRLPWVALAIVVLGLIAMSAASFRQHTQITELMVRQHSLERAADTARAKAELDAREADKKLAEQKAVAELARQDAETAQREAEAAKLASEAARKELEALKAAVPADPQSVPAPAAPPVEPAPAVPQTP